MSGLVQRIDLYDLWKLNGGKPLTALPALSWSEDLLADPYQITRRATLVLATHERARNLVVERAVIRFQLAGGAYRSYRIAGIDDDDPSSRTTLALEGPGFELGDQDDIVHEFDAAGHLILSPKDAGKTPAQALTDRVLSVLPAYWQLGTITPTVMDDVEYGPGTTPLQAALAIAEAASRRTMIRYRLRVEEDEIAGKMKLHLTAPTSAIADVRPARNLLQFLLKSDPRELTTRAIALGANSAHCGQNAWRVTAVDTSGTPDLVDVEDLAGGPGPVQEDDQFVGRYLVGPDGVALAILDSVGLSTTTSRFSVADASSLSVDDWVRLALDSAGRELHFVDAPAAIAAYGKKLGTFNLPLDASTNLLAGNADLRVGGGADLVASPPPGLTITRMAPPILDPLATIAEATGAGQFLTGGRSLKITTGSQRRIGYVLLTDAVHIVVAPLTTRIFTAAVWVNITRGNGGAASYVQLVSVSGATQASLQETLTGLAGKGWQKATVTLSVTNPSGAVPITFDLALRVQMVMDMFFDSYQLSEAQEIASFVAGSNPAAMIQELNRQLYLEGFTGPLRQFEVGLVDLEQMDGTRYPYDALEEGGSIRLVHERLAVPEVLEILRLTRTSEALLTPTIELGSRRRALTPTTGGGSITITPGAGGGSLPGGGGVPGQNPPPAGTPGSPVAPGAPGAPGAPAIPGGGLPRRQIISLLTAPLGPGGMEEGELVLAPTLILMRGTSKTRAWVQLYRTAADMAADAARLIDDAIPADGIVLEVRFGVGVLDVFFKTNRGKEDGVRGINFEDPVQPKLYYRVRFAPELGDPITIFEDNPPGNGVSDVDLGAHAPTNPLDSGVTGYEHTGASDRYAIWQYGGFVPKGGVVDDSLVRANAPVDQTRLRMIGSIYHAAGDGVSDSIYLDCLVPDTAIGTFNNRNVLRVGFKRSGAGAVDCEILHYKSDGTTATVASFGGLSFPNSSGLDLILDLDLDAGTATLSTAVYVTGASETVRCSGAIPAALLVGGQDHVGWNGVRNSSATGFALYNLRVRHSSVQAAVDFTCLQQEAA
jgi:hypothetical protein